MKNTFLRISLFLLLLVTLFAACNKESYIETIGSVSITDADEKEVGYFMFTSKTTVASCGKITIWIDDKIAGYITADYTGSAVTKCTMPPIEGKFIKIVAKAGTHKIHATVENKCRTFNVDTYTLQKGVCRYYNLN